jgi:branched-chain amino acid transport system substrate-binding protein
MKLLNGELCCLTLRDRASTIVMLRSMKLTILALAIVANCCTASAQSSDKKYGPGVTDHEIKLGQTVPYSGPVSAAGALG